MDDGGLFERLRERGALVDIRRDELGGSDIRGFFVALSQELALIRVVADEIRLDGHTIIRREDITLLRWDTAVHRGWSRVLGKAGGGEQVAAEVDLLDWRAAIEWAKRSGPLITFHREGADSERVYIAREVELSGDWIMGAQVTSEGTEDGSFAIRIDDITRLDVGGGYERGLGRMLDTR